MGLLKNKTKYKRLNCKLIDNSKSDYHINRCFKSPHFKLFYNGKYIYFKTQPSIELCYNELICNEIAKQMKINCVEYNLAELTHNKVCYKGLISDNFINKNQSYIECANFSFRENDGLCGVLRNLDDYKLQKIYNFDRDEIELDLFKMIIFDFITCQSDRHDCNFGFIVENSNNGIPTIKVAPLFDNELSFGSTCKRDLTDMWSIINLNLRFTPYNYNRLNIECIMGGESYETAREIIYYAKNKPHLVEYVKSILREFDTQNLHANLQKKNVVIPKKKLDMACNIIREKKRELFRAYIDLLTPKKVKTQKINNKDNSQSK